MAKRRRYSPEVRERAVRMVSEHQAERDKGSRPGLTSEERHRLKELERENREPGHANEIFRAVSASFAQAELVCRPK
jgi:transposase